jgi:hypothetical protein
MHVPHLQLAVTPALRAPYFTTMAFSLGGTFMSPNFGHTPTEIGVAIHLNQPPLSSPMYQLVCRWKGKYGTWRKGSEKGQEADGSEASGSTGAALAPHHRQLAPQVGHILMTRPVQKYDMCSCRVVCHQSKL